MNPRSSLPLLAALPALLITAAARADGTAPDAPGPGAPRATVPTDAPSGARSDPPLPSPPSDAKPADPLEVTVEGDMPGTGTASRITVGRRELELRPRLRPGDVVETVPGLFAVQHAGGGKANQYFLRGFDADHGTDVALSVDGIPVNMVSHGHGQGFSDLHFLIPELVTGLDGYKGPYYANIGDFGTAGAVDLHLAERFEESYAQYSVGQYGIMRGLVIASPDLGDDWQAVTAAELYKNDGPFVNPEALQRFNVYVKATHALGDAGKVQMTWMSYGSSWRGSGQIPARAVCGEGEQDGRNLPPEAFGQPCLDHFGNVDPSQGGATQRHMASLAFATRWQDAELDATAYLIRYRFTLYSNFTFFSDDPVRGDAIEQDDDRVLGGLDLRFRKRFEYRGAKFTTTLGAQVRVDGIDNALYRVEARERLEDKLNAHISEGQIGVYVEEDARVRRWLRFVVGARAQRIDVNVEDRLEDTATARTRSSGIAGETLLLPKVMAVVTPEPGLDFFADFGRGFHSNDARGAVLGKAPVTLMTPATGYELGARVAPVPELSLNTAAFLLDLGSELVWNGDAGGTEASGQTRRFGIEFGARYHYKNWLFADVDATLTRARFRGNGDAVALAPTRTLTAGLGARPSFGDTTPFAALRVKSIGSRPALEDDSLTAEGFTVVDANAGVRWRDLEIAVDVQNLFNATWREAQFANDSRLPYEPQTVTGIHYSPGWPFTAVGRATLYLR